MTTIDLPSLLSVADYQRQREHIFPSKPSIDWQIKSNRAALAECGALVFIAGALYLHPQKADQFFYDLGCHRAGKSKRDPARKQQRREVE